MPQSEIHPLLQAPAGEHNQCLGYSEWVRATDCADDPGPARALRYAMYITNFNRNGALPRARDSHGRFISAIEARALAGNNQYYGGHVSYTPAESLHARLPEYSYLETPHNVAPSQNGIGILPVEPSQNGIGTPANCWNCMSTDVLPYREPITSNLLTLLRWTCEECRDDLFYCEYGNHWVDHSDWSNGEDGACEDHSATEDHGDCDCDECFGGDNDPGSHTGPIYDYSYRPEFQFYGMHENSPSFYWEMEEDEKHQLYIGLELEVSFKNQIREAKKEWVPNLDKLWFVKADSSVTNGFEVVSHPFQPLWGLDSIDLSPFQNLTQKYGAHVKESSCGTHIHMNKDAFTSAHLWKFIMFHQELPDFCGLIGGRGIQSSYGSFMDSSWRAMKNDMLEVAKKKGSNNLARYVAINLENDDTIELRYPEGDVSPEGIRKNIQWALALYCYTAYIDIQDVKDGALKTASNFIWYIKQTPTVYKELIDHIEKRIPSPKPLRERSK